MCPQNLPPQNAPGLPPLPDNWWFSFFPIFRFGLGARWTRLCQLIIVKQLKLEKKGAPPRYVGVGRQGIWKVLPYVSWP